MRETMHGLIQGIVASHEARATGLASLQRDVSAQRDLDRRYVQELKGPRWEAARALRAHLARRRTELDANEARRKSGIRSWLTDVGLGRKAMAGHLRDDLVRGRAALASGVRQQTRGFASGRKAMAGHLRGDLVRGRAALASGVRQQTKEFAGDRLAAGQEWRQIATALRARSAGVITSEAQAPMPAENESPALPDRIFAYLADHPDGVRFVEVERQFRLDSGGASSVLRNLVQEGKAKREGPLYFAT